MVAREVIVIENARLTPGPGFRPMNAFFYYLMRLIPYAGPRRCVAALLAMLVGRGPRQTGSHADVADGVRQRQLRRYGWVTLPDVFSARQIAQMGEFLRGRSVASAAGWMDPERPPPTTRRASYPLADVMDCPHVLATINAPRLLDLAGQYLGCRPTISSIGIHWSFPGHGAVVDMPRFHRDPDDWRFLKLFCYLTDVDESSGPHLYVEGSHRTSGRIRARTYFDDDVANRYGAESVVRIVGLRGTSPRSSPTPTDCTRGVHRCRDRGSRSRCATPSCRYSSSTTGRSLSRG